MTAMSRFIHSFITEIYIAPLKSRLGLLLRSVPDSYTAKKQLWDWLSFRSRIIGIARLGYQMNRGKSSWRGLTIVSSRKVMESRRSWSCMVDDYGNEKKCGIHAADRFEDVVQWFDCNTWRREFTAFQRCLALKKQLVLNSLSSACMSTE